MEAPDECAKENFQLGEYSQKFRINRTKSKEKLFHDQAKGKSNSRLPRIVRTPSKFHKPTKSSTKSSEKLDNSGDALPGPSKLANFPTKMKKEEIPDNLKPSHIPRRKSNKEGSKESCDSTKKVQGGNNNQFIPECRNVQRVHMLINPEFCPEERTQTTSVASTRPIPTLGHIYGRINMVDSDRVNDNLGFTHPSSLALRFVKSGRTDIDKRNLPLSEPHLTPDWILDINAPMNSVSSNPRSGPLGVTNEGTERTSSTVASPPTCHQELESSTMILDRKDQMMSSFPSNNENVSAWLSSEVEFPTRDNESVLTIVPGYKTMSNNNAQTNKSNLSQLEGQSVKTIKTYCLGLTPDISYKTTPSTTQEPCIECSTCTSSLLKEQQTVVLCRTPDFTKEKVEDGTDISKANVTMKPTRMSKPEPKSCVNPSNIHHASAAQTPRVPVPSYTECLSEILQKTTNFENMEGFEFSKPSSSIAVTDIRDNLSNEGTLDQMDDYGVVEDQSNLEWCRHQSNGNMTFVRSDATGTDWSGKYQSEPSQDEQQHHIWNWKHDLCKRYYNESRYGDMRERCKKCQRFKRFPSSRYKLPGTFESWRHRISLRRICRRRWNHVWKKTAERWAMWSSKSPAKCRRFRVLHYLQRSIIWEDADVQTNILIYNETGTDSAMGEQKSAGIGTVFNMGSWQSICNKSDSVSKCLSNKSRLRHVNLGPSMFPFLYNTKRKSLIIPSSNKPPGTGTGSGSVSQYPSYKDSERKNIKEHCANYNWNTDNGQDVCNSVKSCQYEDTIPVHVEKSTSLLQIYELNLTDNYTDTGDLPYYMSDKVTSTVLRFSSHRFPNTPSKDAYTQKVITCHNAETDVTFLPNLEDSPAGAFASACDITYYRPVTGTDITHLITESRTQHALYPILRKFNSNSTSVTREPSIGAETQMSPNTSSNKISTGVSTSTPIFTEKTTSYIHGSMPLRNSIEKCDCAAQAQESKPISTDTQTQMTPDKSKSIISTGITPSSPLFGDKASTFISACLLLGSEIEKDNYAAQTQSPTPNLGFTATKIMSISSRVLTNKNVGSTEVTMEKPPQTNNGSVPVKCLGKTRDVCSCGTGMKRSTYACTRSTSAKGLNTYHDTELLLNNLIKKALAGNVGSHHSQYSQRSDTLSSRSFANYATTSTNTHVGCVETKSIGQTASEIRRLTDGRKKIDTGIQYSEMQDKLGRTETEVRRTALPGRSHLISMCMLNQTTNDNSTQTDFRMGQPSRPLLYKCASMMTSYCGLAQSIQVPNSTLNLSERNDKPFCACAVLCCDTETNTDRCLPNFERPTQTNLLRPQKITSAASTPISKSSKAEIQNNFNNQLLNLSRLIGKKRPSSIIDPPIATPVYSSDFTADKWLKTCSTMDKTYESLIGIAPSCAEEDLKRNSLYSNSSKSEIETRGLLPVGPPTIILSKDSLADVLPVKKSKDFYIKRQNTLQNVNRVMVDEVTSDENVTKDVKESILQACPDICETGTESLVEMYQQKSASVLTTQCFIPSPLPCSCTHLEQRTTGECMFVYGEPRCAVHKRSADASVQMDHPTQPEVYAKRQHCVNHSVGVLTSSCAMPDSFTQRKPSTMIREVLSPKVYKALYETTKMVVNEDTNQPPVRDTSVIAARIDTGVEAAKFHVPDVRSAGVVTSVGRGFGYPQRCYCRDKGTHPNTKCALYHVTKAVNTNEIATDYTHAKLLHMPDENKEGCFEECMKTHLVTSCRYYSNLLTKQLGRVKENLTKHLVQPMDENEKLLQISHLPNPEVCTMKPSGRTELASQTLRMKPYYKVSKPISCCMLSPAVSLTDICKNDKDHLKSVYYMLSAIEGRLRRLKVSVPNSY